MSGPELADPTPSEVIAVAAELFGVEVAAILGFDRHHPLARYRKMTIAACRQATSMSYPELGRVFGGRDHKTIHHACVSVGDDPGALELTERVVDEVRTRRNA